MKYEVSNNENIFGLNTGADLRCKIETPCFWGAIEDNLYKKDRYSIIWITVCSLKESIALFNATMKIMSSTLSKNCKIKPIEYEIPN